MRPRTAKKIVNRVQAGTATHASYNRQTVRQAFQQLQVELPDDLLKPWTDHEEEVARQKEQALANAPSAAARREQKAARVQARIGKAEARRERARALQAAKKATEDYKADPEEPLWTGQQPGATVENIAVAAGREAFNQAIENEIDELPEAVEMIPDTGEPDNKYAEMSVKALKAECKNRGLKGYSGLKRPELTAMLTVQDNDL